MYEFKTEPYQHQKDIFEKNLSMPYAGLLMEMGTGKSKICIDTAAALYEAGKIQRVLIIGNNGSYANWINKEVPAHLPDRVPSASIFWKQASGAKWSKLLNAFRDKRHNSLLFFSVNIEATINKSNFDLFSRYLSSADSMLIVDESSTVKNHKAQRTKAIIKLARYAKYRRILTGTPIGNGPLDLYSQCEVLEKGALGFSSYYSFRAYYAIMREIMPRGTGRTVKIVNGYRELDKLKTDLSKFSFIVKKEDCLSLPEKIYQRYEVELTPKQKKWYEELKKTAVIELSECETVSAPVILTKLLKLHQLVCGILKPDDGVEVLIENNRMKALKAILDECPRPVVIWANYRKNIQSILDTLGSDARSYYGDTTGEERIANINDFQAGKVPYLVCNAQSAGYGITLTRSHTAIYFSNNYSAELRQQSEDRIHRIGQDKKVTYVDIVCPGTVDEKILDALRMKKNLAQKIVSSEGYKNGWKDIF